MTHDELLEVQRRRRKRLFWDMKFKWGSGPIPIDWDTLQFIPLDYQSRLSVVEKLVRTGAAR